MFFLNIIREDVLLGKKLHVILSVALTLFASQLCSIPDCLFAVSWFYCCCFFMTIFLEKASVFERSAV